MPLAVLTIGVIAEILQRRILVVQLPETVRMSGQRIDGEVFQVGPADLRSHPPEIPFQQSVRRSHRFEDLRRGNCGSSKSPSLEIIFSNPLFNALTGHAGPFRQLNIALGNQPVEHGESHIRIDFMLAPNPISNAICITSRASAVSTISAI